MTDIFLFILYHLPFIVLIIYLIFNEYLTPQTLAWIILLWVQPWLGLLLYIAFNVQPRRFIPKWTSQDQQSTQPKIDPHPLPHKWKFLNPLGTTFNQMPYTYAESIDIFENTNQTLNEMLLSIDQAHDHIYLTTYIYKSDSMGIALIESLQKAQNRGVKIHILLDSYGSLLFLPFSKSYKKFKSANLSYQLFLPMKDWRFWILFNIRMHAKILVIDHTVAFIGSMNIRYFDLRKSPLKKRELTFKIYGPVIQQIIWISKHFLSTSKHTNPIFHSKKNKHIIPNTHDNNFLCNPSPQPSNVKIPIRAIYRDVDYAASSVDFILSSVIDHAQSSIQIRTPYFIPPSSIRRALRKAVARGVIVTVLIPGKVNFLLKSAALVIAEELISYGVSFYILKNEFDHTKVMIVDDIWITSGSINFDTRSLFINLETNIELLSRSLAKKLKEKFEDRLQYSYKLTNFYKTNKINKIIGNSILLFSPLL